MMNWFIENREWLFSGAGITVLAIIYGIIRWYMNKSRESHSQGVVNVTKTGPIDVSVIAGVDQGLASESDMEDAKQRLATQRQPTFISFDDIQEAIGNAPPLQRDQVKENFIGITVDWIAYLNSAEKKDNGLIGLSLSADKRKSFKFIYCTIPLAEYPEIKILPENSRIQIRGEIEKAGNIDVTLKNVKLTFIKDG